MQKPFKMNSKLRNLGANLLWLLGALIFIAQTYRVLAFYLFEQPMDIVWTRDGLIAVIAFAMMFVQSSLKTAVRKIINKKTQ